jgi:hypothetical protein
MKSSIPRVILIVSAGLVSAGLFWALIYRGAGEEARVVVPAAADPAALPVPPVPDDGTVTRAPAEMERRILEAIGEPGTRIVNVRIVDQKRQIVCGERIDRRSAAVRRFVWLSQLNQIVTDNGGQNFAILLHVCSPPPSS